MSTTINRELLVYKLTMAKPAVLAQSYVPILTTFMFDGKAVTAYNDINAISFECVTDFEGCVPSELLLKTLKSMTTESVTMERFPDHMLVSAGRSKIKLPVFSSKDFPSPFNKLKNSINVFAVDENVLKGLKLCLIGVGKDQSHPAEVGVTVDPFYSQDQAALYSTDNATLSRFIFDTESEQHDPIIMPTFFCEELLALAKPTHDIIIEIYEGALVADFGDGTLLFTKMLADVQPKAFEDVIKRYLDSSYHTHAIPDLFDQSFERAILVQEAEIISDTTVIVENKRLTLHSRSLKSGEAFDAMVYNGEDIQFHIDPVKVKRISPVTSKIALLSKVMVLTDDKEDFIHLIAHRSVAVPA